MTDGTTETSAAFDTELADELEQLEYYSHNETVEVRIVQVTHKDRYTAYVTFVPPLGEAFTKELAVPRDPTTTTEFTKLLRETGRNFSTAPKIIGDRVPARYTENGWEIQYSEPTRSRKEQAVAYLTERPTADHLKAFLIYSATLGTLLFWPILGVPGCLLVLLDDNGGEGFSFVEVTFLYVFLLIVWFFVAVSMVGLS